MCIFKFCSIFSEPSSEFKESLCYSNLRVASQIFLCLVRILWGKCHVETCAEHLREIAITAPPSCLTDPCSCCSVKAYAAAEFAQSCLRALQGESGIIECAYVASEVRNDHSNLLHQRYIGILAYFARTFSSITFSDGGLSVFQHIMRSQMY